MPSRKYARLAFAVGFVLLALSGAAVIFTILRLSDAVLRAAHSYDVEVAVAKIESIVAETARARLAYITTHDERYFEQYQLARTEISPELSQIRQLTSGNPFQQGLCDQLETLIHQRVDILDTSIQLRKSGVLDTQRQGVFSTQNTNLASNVAVVIHEMEGQEEATLQQRRQVTGTLFTVALCVLLAVFALAMLLLWVNYRFLTRELAQREEAEKNARRLSARVLRLQDEERRRFSRELHDSLGQNLAAALMSLSAARKKYPNDNALTDCLHAIEQVIAETRTISHLLHPPLLDEVGFASAARNYVEGFAKRSGVHVSMDMSESLDRLPNSVELVLFRVLQESLTNIHRHSGSDRAEVSFRTSDGSLSLRIRDYGKGIGKETLERFLRTGLNAGVGLAGMRERVREQGGVLEITPQNTGTLITVTIPMRAAANEPSEAGSTPAESANHPPMVQDQSA